MKKFLVSAVVLFGIGAINAQSFGIKGGYNYATLSGDQAQNSEVKGKSGFYVGGFAEFEIGDIFAIQPEILYSQQGAKWETKGLISGKTYSAKLNMDYVNIPVLAKIKFGDVFSLQGGPQFGFLVNKPSVEVDTPILAGSTSIDKDAYATFDFGVAVGASFYIKKFFIDLRYTHGLTNVFDKDNQSLKAAKIGEDNNFKNSYLSLGVGFKL